MRVSIEKRYEYMLNDLNTKLESLKKHFNNIINDAKGEAFNSIVNEKDHNLSNIKEYLEEKLLKYIQSENNPNASAADKDAQQNIEGSFHDFFSFFHDFREECFGMIVSKITNLNLENLKNQIQHFKSKYLESILNAPKVFTSQLFRYFEDSLKQNPEQKQHVTKGFGDVLSIKQEFTDSANFSKLGKFYDPELNCKSKTPMISIINKDYLIVVSRDRFRIAGYQYSNSGAKIPKSRFYTNTHNDTGEELTFSDVYCSEAALDDKGEAVSYHSVCAAKTQDDNYCILLGGNDCKLYIYSLMLSPTGEFQSLKQLKSIEIRKTLNMVKQKVNVILQYKQTNLVVCCLSYGYIVVFDFSKLETASQWKVHKGNITSACFVNDYEYFVTASGSFSKNHDNSIIVSKVSLAMSDLFFKKSNTFSSAHGKHKGVMNIKSSNQKGDMLLVSCGNEDDPQIKIWNIKDQSVIGKYAPEDPAQHKPYYYLNVLYLDHEVQIEKNIFANQDESKVKKGFIIAAASIKSVDLFMKNPDEQGFAIINLSTQDDVGSYLSSVTTIKHTEDHLTVLVANVSGTVELFDLKFEKTTSNDNTDSDDDDISNESDELKRQDSKQAKEDHIEIDAGVNLRELIELRRQKDHFSELDEQSEGQGEDLGNGGDPAVQSPAKEGTVILESPTLNNLGLGQPGSTPNQGTRTDLAGGVLTNPAITSTQINPSSVPPSDLQLKPVAIERGLSGNI